MTVASNEQAQARGRPMTAVWIGVVCFSIGPVLAASVSVSGAVLAFWRLWLGVPVMAGAALWQRRRSGSWPSRQSWRWPVLAGIAFAFHQLLFMSALQQTTVVDVTLMN